MLVTAAANLRPDLFRAVVTASPFVDVLNTMLDPSLPLTTGEYIEWGNPNVAKEYAYIKSYSPYDNIQRKPYPAMLLEVAVILATGGKYRLSPNYRGSLEKALGKF